MELLLIEKGVTANRRMNAAIRTEIEDIIDCEITIDAMKNLFDILLLELQTTGDKTIIIELKSLAKRLENFGQKQYAYSILAESKLLNAKLALIHLKINEAREFMSQAQQIADSKGLNKLARKISREHDKLIYKIDKWEDKALPCSAGIKRG